MKHTVMYAKFERALPPPELRQRNLETDGFCYTMMTKVTIEQPGNTRTIRWDERPRRHVMMEFLAALRPEDVYGITEQEQGDSQLTVVYYRLYQPLGSDVDVDEETIHQAVKRQLRREP